MLVSSTFVVPPVPPVFSRPGAFLCYCETLRPKESSFFNVNIIHISNPLFRLLSPPISLFPSTKSPYNDNNFHERKENRVEILFSNVNILHIIARALFREFLFPSAFHAASVRQAAGVQAGQRGIGGRFLPPSSAYSAPPRRTACVLYCQRSSCPHVLYISPVSLRRPGCRRAEHPARFRYGFAKNKSKSFLLTLI